MRSPIAPLRVVSLAYVGLLSFLGSGCANTASPSNSAGPETPALAESATTPVAGAASSAGPASQNEADLQALALALAKRTLVLDGHVDLPFRLQNLEGGLGLDLTVGDPGGEFDLPRTRSGGLDAPFMSIYTPASLEGTGESKALADQLIDLVESIETRWPQHFKVVRSTAELEAAFEHGLIALPMGMENGSPIEGKLENLHHFHHRGIRYITLAHSKTNHLSDSSYDENRPHGGLSTFGVKVVGEMNRLGIMVDVSHLSDDAFWDVMKHSRAPAIASHSSCRHFTPGFERNMSDEMIVELAKHGGVIQINFGSTFLDADVRERADEHRPKIAEMLKARGIDSPWSEEARPYIIAYNEAHPGAYTDVEKVADHIEHVIKLVGIDHVGLGSDFDGVGDSLPIGLKHAGEIPNLFRVLLGRGYSEADIKKIASGNVIRVWKQVEAVARGQQ